MYFEFSADAGGVVRCTYVARQDRVVFASRYAVGARKDLNGILLLDSALQAPISKPDSIVRIELPLPEVSYLFWHNWISKIFCCQIVLCDKSVTNVCCGFCDLLVLWCCRLHICAVVCQRLSCRVWIMLRMCCSSLLSRLTQ